MPEEFCFTKGQLELLAQCIECNDCLSSALLVFFETAALSPSMAGILNWLRHAEHIKADSNYIAGMFDRPCEVIQVECTA